MLLMLWLTLIAALVLALALMIWPYLDRRKPMTSTAWKAFGIVGGLLFLVIWLCLLLVWFIGNW